jgi:hypothetical protein
MERESTDEPATGFPEPPASDEPGNISGDPTPHHSLNNPVGEPDPTEYPDPYETREDPAAPGERRAPTGRTSTSDPHPDQDIAAPDANPPQRDRLDD